MEDDIKESGDTFEWSDESLLSQVNGIHDDFRTENLYVTKNWPASELNKGDLADGIFTIKVSGESSEHWAN